MTSCSYVLFNNTHQHVYISRLVIHSNFIVTIHTVSEPETYSNQLRQSASKDHAEENFYSGSFMSACRLKNI